MNSKERVLTALNLGKPDRIPFMEWYYDYEIGEGILGRDDYQREEIAEALCMDGIGTYVGPEACAEKLISSEGRRFEGRGLLASHKDLKMIQLPNPRDSSLYDNVKKTLDEYGERFFIFTGMNSGADLLLRGMGLENFSYALHDNIKLIEDIIDIYSDWAAEAVCELQKTGIDAIWFADDIAFATSLMFSPDFFREVIKPRMKKVIDNVKLPVIYHSDGNLTPIISDLIELGIKALHPIEPTALDIEEVKAKWGDKLCLIGNIDLGHTLVYGTAKEVEEEVKSRIEKVGYNGGYILASANSLTDYCRTENILAMRDTLLKYGTL